MRDIKAVRTCLGLNCGKSFASEHSANRICNDCKNARKKSRSNGMKIMGKISPLESGQDYQRNALALHYQRNVVAG
jgi:predicted nucleic acid-binding protein